MNVIRLLTFVVLAFCSASLVVRCAKLVLLSPPHTRLLERQQSQLDPEAARQETIELLVNTTASLSLLTVDQIAGNGEEHSALRSLEDSFGNLLVEKVVQLISRAAEAHHAANLGASEVFETTELDVLRTSAGYLEAFPELAPMESLFFSTLEDASLFDGAVARGWADRTQQNLADVAAFTQRLEKDIFNMTSIIDSYREIHNLWPRNFYGDEHQPIYRPRFHPQSPMHPTHAAGLAAFKKYLQTT